MALVLLSAIDRLPLSLDVLDTDSYKGGEVVTWMSTPREIVNPNAGTPGQPATLTNTAADTSSADYWTKNLWTNDSTSGTPNTQLGFLGKRPLVSKTALTATSNVAYLVDSGSKGYGTQFGSWLGGNAGLGQSDIAIGPGTYETSGKVVGYRAGLFAVTLDAVAQDCIPPGFVGAADSVATHTWITGGGMAKPGDELFAVPSTGLLTLASSGNLKVGVFIGFETQLGAVRTKAPYLASNPYANLKYMVFEFGV